MTRCYRLADGHGLDDLLEALCAGHEVFAPRAGQDGQYHLVRSEGWRSDLELGSYRTLEPTKSLFFRPRELVGLIPAEALVRPRSSEDSDDAPIARVAVGVKSCDLSSFAVQDHVFVDSKPVDPGYEEARKVTLLVTADCTDCLDVCFCTAVGQTPYPTEGFDINVAPIEVEGRVEHIIEVGSDRGSEALRRVSEMLDAPDEGLLARRDRARASIGRKVTEQAERAGLRPEQDLQAAIRASDDAMWTQFASRCVECGACNFVCCTCHCFLLADGVTSEGQPARTKQWDACLFENFARVAGGGNPRAERASRLKNRFEKKFDFFFDRIGQYACNGCGRCTEVCTAEIDIREVLRTACERAAAATGDAT